MKTRYSILIISLLALFATGCKKENNGHIRIFTENMKGDSKILINPYDIVHSTWVAGEYIAINGNPYMISVDEDNGGFCLDGVNAEGSMLAIYPAGSFGGDDIVVNNNEVILKRLTINFCNYDIEDMEGDDNYYYYYGAEKVVFPMMATADAGSDRLLFNHLTGGLKVTLENDSYYDIDIASIKIVAQSDNALQNLGVNGVTARWAVQGPALPHGEVGEEECDYLAANVSEMNFDFTTTRYDWDDNVWEDVLTTVSGMTAQGSGESSFCVPITISSLRYITIIGYSANGSPIFHVTKDLGTETTISVNTMYTLPNIIIATASDGE